jgi:hypothetical protein
MAQQKPHHPALRRRGYILFQGPCHEQVLDSPVDIIVAVNSTLSKSVASIVEYSVEYVPSAPVTIGPAEVSVPSQTSSLLPDREVSETLTLKATPASGGFAVKVTLSE